jgi:hypothetical protein
VLQLHICPPSIDWAIQIKVRTLWLAMSDFRHLMPGRARLFGSWLCRIIVSALLVAIDINVNGPLDASNEVPAPCVRARPKLEKSSDQALGQFQQSEQAASQTTNPKLVLTDGTAVRLRFVRAVVSSQVIAGEKIPLEVVEPVLVGKLVAIPQHSAEEAIVTMAQAGRSMGRGGNLQFKIENIRLADGELVPVRAVKDVKGGGRRAAAIIANMTVWPFAVKGKEAVIPEGAEIAAYIAGDFSLNPSKFQDAATVPREKNAPQ